MKRCFIIFKGRVQGVGFRYFAMMTAKSENLTGHVRNLSNGHVEAEVQGSSENFDRFLQQILKGNGFMRVEDYSLKEIPTKDNEKDFKIKG